MCFDEDAYVFVLSNLICQVFFFFVCLFGFFFEVVRLLMGLKFDFSYHVQHTVLKVIQFVDVRW